MRRVILLTPFEDDPEYEMHRYVMDCMANSLLRGEAPFAPHVLYEDVLNDAVQGEHELCVQAGYAWLELADAMVVYVDYGVSESMQNAIEEADKVKVPVEVRTLRTGRIAA